MPNAKLYYAKRALLTLALIYLFAASPWLGVTGLSALAAGMAIQAARQHS